jgi:hypothetical protein
MWNHAFLGELGQLLAGPMRLSSNTVSSSLKDEVASTYAFGAFGFEPTLARPNIWQAHDLRLPFGYLQYFG